MTPPLPQNSLRGTGFKVSPICLGTMTFGNPVSREDAIRLVHWALDHGINFFDTADMYEGYDRKSGSPGGVAERILGEALRGRYNDAIVTTKVGCDVGEGENLRPTYIRQQIEASLSRLGCDCVDLYELHKPDPNTPLVETLAVMNNLIQTGKIRHWGFSNYNSEQIDEMVRLCHENSWPKPVVSQPPYSWLRRDIEQEHLPACETASIAITPYQPLQGGLLTGKYKRNQSAPAGSRATESGWLKLSEDKLFDQLEMFESEAHQSGLTPGQYAVRWLLDQPGVISVVLGVKKIEQLQDLVFDAT